MLYSFDQKRTPKTILQLYNVSWFHHELCCHFLTTVMRGLYIRDTHSVCQYELELDEVQGRASLTCYNYMHIAGICTKEELHQYYIITVLLCSSSMLYCLTKHNLELDKTGQFWTTITLIILPNNRPLLCHEVMVCNIVVIQIVVTYLCLLPYASVCARYALCMSTPYNAEGFALQHMCLD